jgi:dTDP-4-dehydrorhamnose reductase
VHVTDLADYYTRLIQRIIEQHALPAGNDGYYLVSAHTINWHELLQALANGLHTRGLVLNADVTVWPSEEVKMKSLGLPAPYSDIAWNSKQVSPSLRQGALGCYMY